MNHLQTGIKSLLLVFFLSLASCSSPIGDEVFGSKEGSVIQAVITSSSDSAISTRVSIHDDGVKRMEVLWSTADRIGLCQSEGGLNLAATLHSGEGTKTATFITEGGLWPDQKPIYAYFPYQTAIRVNTTANEVELTGFHFAAVQHYRTDGPDVAALAMAGREVSPGAVAFNNLFAIIKMELTGDESRTLRYVHFTDLAGQAVVGAYSVCFPVAGGVPVAGWKAETQGASLSLDCGDGLKLSDTPQVLHLVVPARNYTQGYSVTFETADGQRMRRTVGIAGNGKILAASCVYPMKAVAFVPDATEETISAMEINASNLSIGVGVSQYLYARTTPFAVKGIPIRWTSSDAEVVSIARAGFINELPGATSAVAPSITLTGQKEGTAVITATSPDGKHVARCTVLVGGRGGGYFLPGVTIEKGWFDANKFYDYDLSTPVGSLCWAFAASNIIDWWQAVLPESALPPQAPRGAALDEEGHPMPTGFPYSFQSNVVRTFNRYSRNQGYQTDMGWEWYFTAAAHIPSKEPGVGTAQYGGFYSDIFGQGNYVADRASFYNGIGRPVTREQAIAGMKQIMIRSVGAGWGTGMGYALSGYNGGHAITVWGYELADEQHNGVPDESEMDITSQRLASRKGDKMVAYLYISDSDDVQHASRNLMRAILRYNNDGTITIGYRQTAGKVSNIFYLRLPYGTMTVSPVVN